MSFVVEAVVGEQPKIGGRCKVLVRDGSEIHGVFKGMDKNNVFLADCTVLDRYKQVVVQGVPAVVNCYNWVAILPL